MTETEAPRAFRHVITGKKARLHSRFWHCSWSFQQQHVDPYSLGLRLSIDIAEKYKRNGRVKGNP